MKKTIKITSFALVCLLINSCGNEVEEIKDPITGKVLKKYEYYKDDNGQIVKDGESLEWDGNGTLLLKQNFEDGKLNGESIVYHTQDSIYFNNYVDDKKEGECRLENAKGVVLSKYNYKNDILTGEQLYNYASGKLMLKAHFDDHLPVRTWNYFSENGKPAGIITFKDGICQELIGKWKIKGEKEHYFEFFKDGTYSESFPLFRYSQNATEFTRGSVFVGNRIRLISNGGLILDEFLVINIQKNTLEVLTEEMAKITMERVN